MLKSVLSSLLIGLKGEIVGSLGVYIRMTNLLRRPIISKQEITLCMEYSYQTPNENILIS